jgi:hypothetical protein
MGTALLIGIAVLLLLILTIQKGNKHRNYYHKTFTDEARRLRELNEGNKT